MLLRSAFEPIGIGSGTARDGHRCSDRAGARLLATKKRASTVVRTLGLIVLAAGLIAPPQLLADPVEIAAPESHTDVSSEVPLIGQARHSARAGDRLYYPAGPTEPLRVGAEKFQNELVSLEGLTGLHIDFEGLYEGAAAAGAMLDPEMETRLREKLANAGLAVLSEEESLIVPGQPALRIWPSLDGGAATANSTSETGDATLAATTVGDLCNCCFNSLWVALQQSGTILRSPNKHFRFSTWGAGDQSTQCSGQAQWLQQAIESTFDKFIADFEQVELDRQPYKVTVKADVPRQCEQPWMVSAPAFEGSGTSILPEIEPILDQLAANAIKCPEYRYLIETRNRDRDGNHFNTLLSIARTHSVTEYLMRRGLVAERLQTLGMGEGIDYLALDEAITAPFAPDHAAGPQQLLVIIPQHHVVTTELEKD